MFGDYIPKRIAPKALPKKFLAVIFLTKHFITPLSSFALYLPVKILALNKLALDSTLDKVRKLAESHMSTGKYHCAEAILLSLGETLQLPVDIKYVSGFGRGLGGTKCVCGAYNGSIVVLNLLYGADKRGLDISQSRAMDTRLEKVIHKFEERWKQKNKYTCCKLLTKSVAWGSPEHFKHCTTLTGDAAEILWSLIAEIETGQTPL